MPVSSTRAADDRRGWLHPPAGGIALSIALVLGACSPRAVATELDYSLVWSDEFEGTAVDPTKWQFQIGDGCPYLCGWGNNELQYYRADNATVSGGKLTITARDEPFMGYDYTSARLRTLELGDWTYGRIEMRAKMPIGAGLWPALWMLPTDEVYGGWAASGEIDIVEYLGQEPGEVLTTIHYGGPWPLNWFWSSSFELPEGTFHDAFHDFALEWSPHEIRWYVDGDRVACQSHWYSTGGAYPAPFDEDFHLLINMAVGGYLPGPPLPTTEFPQEYVIDHVRVLQRPEFPQCETLFAGMDHGNPFINGWFAFDVEAGDGFVPTASDMPVEGCNAALDVAWGAEGTPGYLGGFGRIFPSDVSRHTHFEFWINPDADQDYTIEINLQDDDDGDNALADPPDGSDDEFQFDCLVGPGGPCAVSGGGWQRVSIPITDFYDDNSYHFGGNGVFDPVPTGSGGNGQLVTVVFSLISNTGQDVTFRTDRWAFTRNEAVFAGRVWDDVDADGVPEVGEPGLDGVVVDLLDSAATIVQTTATAGGGEYEFAGLPWDGYTVAVKTDTLPAGVSPTADPDGLASPHTAEMLLGCTDAFLVNDFGYAPAALPVPPNVTVAMNPLDPSQIDIDYDAATCPGSDYLVVYGTLGDFSTVTGADCSIGSSGSVTTTPPSGDFWMLVVGREGSRYSSAGEPTAGERTLSGIDAFCPELLWQDVVAACR